MSFTPFDNNNANSSKRSVGLPLSFPSHSMISLISNANPNTMSLNIVPGCMVPIRSMASTNTVESSRVEELTQEALRLTREAFHGVSKGQHQAEQIANDEAVSVEPNENDYHPDTPSACYHGARLNKFVRRLHDMLQAEREKGVVEWRKGLLVLHSTDLFARQILPKYFNTRNFKTFRRQLNYYGFVHVRSFSTTGAATTALWVNRELAHKTANDISSVLSLRRVEPCESAKTTEARRVRKEMAIHTVEEDIGVSAKTLQMEQIRCLAQRGGGDAVVVNHIHAIPTEISYLKDSPLRSRSPSSLDSCSHTPSRPLIGRLTAEVVSESSDEESAANLLLELSKSTLYGR